MSRGLSRKFKSFRFQLQGRGNLDEHKLCLEAHHMHEMCHILTKHKRFYHKMGLRISFMDTLLHLT